MALPWDMADALSFGVLKIMIEHLSSEGNAGLDSGITGLTAEMKISAAKFRLTGFPKSPWLFIPTFPDSPIPDSGVWVLLGVRNKSWEFI